MSVNIFRSHSKSSFAESGKIMARKSTAGAFLLTTVYAVITSLLIDNLFYVISAFTLPFLSVVFFILTYSKLKNELLYKLLSYFLVFSSWVILLIAYQINFQKEYVIVMMTVFILILQVIPTPKKLIYYGVSVFPVLLLVLILSNSSIQFSSIILFLFLFSFVLSYILAVQRRFLLRNLSSNSSILKALINNTNDAFLIVNHLSKKIKDVNQRTLKLFKVPMNESVFDNDFKDLFVDENYLETNRSLISQQLSGQGYYEDEVLFKTHQNGSFWGNLFLSPFNTSKNNYYLLQVKDIDIRKKFDQKITENYEKYRFILDELDEFVYIMRYSGDEKGTFEYLNPSIEKIFGVKKHEFITPTIQKKVSERYHPDDILKVTAKKKVMLESKEKTNFKYRMKPIGKDDFIWIEETVVPKLDEDGNVESLFGIMRKVEL
jgi:PAS domain S-box-containing protein